MAWQKRTYTDIAVLLACLFSSSLAAQENRVVVEQVAPLPVIALTKDDDSAALPGHVRFTLAVDAQCTLPSEDDRLVLAIADQTFSSTPKDTADVPVEVAVLAEQLAGLQVDSLCRRRVSADSNTTPWLLAGAFNVQATLVCTSGDRPNHVTAATALDVTVDCARAGANVPTKTPASDSTPNQQPAG